MGDRKIVEIGSVVTFTLAGMTFEYDEKKNQKNIRKHGISFKNAARVFFDYDRIELFDEENSGNEERFDIIGDISAGNLTLNTKGDFDKAGTVIGYIGQSKGEMNEILFVVYTERTHMEMDGSKTDITRLISARLATNFERGLYYGKY